MKQTTMPILLRLLALAAAWLAGAASAAASPRVDAASLEQAARAMLEAHLALHSIRFEVKAVTPLPTIDLAGGRLQLAARPLAAAQKPTPRMQVWVDVRTDGRFVRTLPVAFDVKAYRVAWVATQDGRTGETLDRAALVQRDVDIAVATSEPLAALPPSARLRRALLAGEPLSASHVEPVPAVQRGAPVVVLSRIGAIGIEARAESLQDGHAGSKVWVRLATSTGAVRARVVGMATVEVSDE